VLVNQKQTASIDFSPLNTYKSSPNFGGWKLFPIIGIAMFCIGLTLKIDEATGNTITLMILLSTLLIGVYVGVELLKQRRVNTAALQAFANRNGLTYTPKRKPVDEPGTLFTHGHSKQLHDVLAGTLQTLPYQFSKYTYTTGSGKNRRTHDAMVMELTLPRVLPHIVIDSVIESSESVLPIQFDKTQKIELEGDFHTYFDLYAPDTYGITALTILAPDTMAILMEHAALCDVEIIQNKLYFYWPLPPNNRQDYEDMYQSVQAVIVKTFDTLTTSNIFGSALQQQVHSVAAASGIRLKNRNGIVASLLLVTVFIGAQIAEETALRKAGPVLTTMLILAAAGVVLYRAVRTARLKKLYLSRYKSK
jgi:hypothetical protein